jgi:thioredoxin 1
MAADLIKYLNEDNFANETASGVVLIDFYADWCGPCRMMTPILEELATKYKDKVTIAKLDIETGQRKATDHGVTSIPTLIILVNGQQVWKGVGVKRADVLEQEILKHLK